MENRKNLLIILTVGIILIILIILGWQRVFNSSTKNITPTPVIPTPSKITTHTTNLSIQNFAFSPSIDEVNSGETVIWTNKDNMEHSVVFEDGEKSDVLTMGKTYKRTFTAKGVYNYKCGIHNSMVGEIIVK